MKRKRTPGFLCLIITVMKGLGLSLNAAMNTELDWASKACAEANPIICRPAAIKPFA